jgi:hypothetical protein
MVVLRAVPWESGRCIAREVAFSVNRLDRLVNGASYRKSRRSQWVDATLAWSLLAGVSKPKVFRGR